MSKEDPLKETETFQFVSVHTSLRERISKAHPGATLKLEEGIYEGNLVIDRPVVLWGNSRVIIRSGGYGTTIRVKAPGTKIIGLTVDGSGLRYDMKDAAIYIQADNCLVKDVLITNATYGIVVEKASHVVIESNIIYGNSDSTLGLRGDAIRFWEMRYSVICGNVVDSSKDVIIWYSHSNQITDNTIKRSRYGTHFMYSHENFVKGNRYLNNVVGTFIMYSRDITLKKNLFADSSGAAGYGVGVKESGNLRFIKNDFVKNTIGIYLDVSPYDPRHRNDFYENQIVFCHTGVSFHGSPNWNVFVSNHFQNNIVQVSVDGGGNAREIVWERNYFDDYEGYDLNGDGIGDIPYELRSFTDDIGSKNDFIYLFRGMISLELIDFMAKAFPLFTPRLILTDKWPSRLKYR